MNRQDTGDTVVPAEIRPEYYSFSEYVSKERMLTFWHQLDEVLACEPQSVLEVGVGSRVVSGALREMGVDLVTADINEDLSPDHLVAVQELDTVFEADAFDVVLCARVLHHIPLQEFGRAVEQLGRVARRAVVLTLPVDDLRLYWHFRLTSRRARVASLRLPRSLKRLALRGMGVAEAYYHKLWKIGSAPETRLSRIQELLGARFEIERSYGIPEDRSHHVFVLRPRSDA